MRLFSLLFLAFLLASGCHSDYDAPCRERIVIRSFPFVQQELAALPYGSADTIMFTSSVDTVYFLTSHYSNAQTLITSPVEGNPECLPDYDGYDAVDIQLVDSISNRELLFQAFKIKDSLQYTISGRSLQLPLSAIGRIDSTFSDSLFTGNRMFYEVNRFANAAGDSFYINRTYGLIRFFNMGTPYVLQKFNSR